MDSDLSTGLGLQETGATGVVVGGPVKVGTAIWWKVDFGSGVDGWVKAAVLTASGTSVTVTMNANPSSVTAGGASTLTWAAQGAASCTASGAGDFTGAKGASGSAIVRPAVTTTYSLSCTGNGSTGASSTTVTVTGSAIAVSLVASPSSIVTGGSSTLNWTSTGATACTAAGGTGFTGAVATNGSATVQPTQTTNYSITCATGGVSLVAATSVTVGAGTGGGANSAFANPDNGAIPDRAKHPIAFPTAIGFGKNTSVRSPNAVVYKINSLEDSANPGDGKITYRECALALPVTSPYNIPAGRPRYCVFDVAGAIVMQSPAFITTPKIYIAGQTSPGGIEFRLGDNYDPVDSLIDTRKGGNDFILRHVRARTGPHLGRTSQNGDPIRMSTGVSNQIIDHVSTMFGTDESLDMSCSNCTVQWSIIGPNICRNAGHISNHCKSFFLKPAGNVTVAHNLSQHGEQRGINIAVGTHPIVNGTAMQADIFNNVLYHFVMEQGLVSNQFGSVYANYFNNVSLRGPKYNATNGNYLIGLYGLSTTQYPFGFNIYSNGNVTPHVRIAGQFGQTVTDPSANAAGFIHGVTPSMVCGVDAQGVKDCGKQGMSVVQNNAFALPPGKLLTSFEPWQVTSAEQGMRDVLAFAGADLCLNGQCRDNVDALYIEDVRTCDTAPNLFSTEWASTVAEAGGWAKITPGAAKADTDNDGMPDDWERRFTSTDPNVWDANDDKDGDGYPNIEEYLNFLARDDIRYSGFIGSGTGALPAYNCGRAMGARV